MKERMKRALCAAMALLLAMAPAAAAEEWDWGWFAPKAEATPVPQREHEGCVRVLLSSLGTPETVLLTLEGVYSVENDAGFTFAPGTDVVLSAVDDCIYMVTGGLTLALGGEVTFTRHADESGEAGGIVIAQAGSNLYPGDLTVWAAGGGLTLRLTAPMEEYLQGVVAYEMSDSFPMEALKAQAVAARTYAFYRVWNSQKRNYDLLDTPQDQVFKGVNGEYRNVAQAVEETCGVVGFYKDAPAVCYFTASNGGQTALATDIWGGSGDYGYLAIADDPYDLENPKSLVNSIDVYVDFAANGEELRQLLTAKAGGARIVEITGVEAAQPRFENTRQYEKVIFTVTVQTEESVRVPLWAEDLPEWMREILPQTDGRVYAVWPRITRTEGVQIVLDTYADVKDGLKTGLNGGDYEMLSVEETDGGWRVSMRRFGHGVGMSQRGAQWMAAQYGRDFWEILAFYYPGMTFETVAWTYAPAELDDAAVTLLRSRGIAGAAQSPGELREGEKYARVKLSSASSTLNLRAEPGTQAEILAVLINRSRVIVTETREDGWCRVRTAAAEGYVKSEYLSIEE